MLIVSASSWTTMESIPTKFISSLDDTLQEHQMIITPRKFWYIKDLMIQHISILERFINTRLRQQQSSSWVNFQEDTPNGRVARWDIILTTVNCIVLNLVILVMIFYIFWKMSNALKILDSTMSRRSKRLQIQFFRALKLQVRTICVFCETSFFFNSHFEKLPPYHVFKRRGKRKSKGAGRGEVVVFRSCLFN